MTVFLIILGLFLLYLLATQCRRGHPGLQQLHGWRYAHRGLHGNGIPENSMAAFRAALEGGYGIELDVHLLADGNLAVMHDSSLMRTAGADVCLEDLTADRLCDYTLEGTQERIPLLQQVLSLFDGKAPLIIELKSERNNYAALTETACKMLDGYKGAYCFESFDPRCIFWLRKHRPDIIRGQLAENWLRNKRSKLPLLLKWILTFQLVNFLICPDFIAYAYHDRKNISNFFCRKLWGAQGVTWTVRTQKDCDTAVKEGWLPIFEGFRP